MNAVEQLIAELSKVRAGRPDQRKGRGATATT
jgi:hypothetical protein